MHLNKIMICFSQNSKLEHIVLNHFHVDLCKDQELSSLPCLHPTPLNMIFSITYNLKLHISISFIINVNFYQVKMLMFYNVQKD